MNDIVLISIPETTIKNIVQQAISKALTEHFSLPTQQAENEKDELITRQEAAKILKLKSLVSIDNLSRKGLLKKHRLGSVVRFKRGEVIAFANNQKKRG